MIHPESLSHEWIQSVATRLGKVDKALLEKAIRALFLVEKLKVRGLDFQFKGGTSLLLHLPTPQRFSIDVDIVTTANRVQLIDILQFIADGNFFTRWEEDVRAQKRPDLPVEHFKLFYKSQFPGFTPENYILLDVIYHQQLPTWTEAKPVAHPWLITENETTSVILYTKEGLLGDKFQSVRLRLEFTNTGGSTISLFQFQSVRLRPGSTDMFNPGQTRFNSNRYG